MDISGKMKGAVLALFVCTGMASASEPGPLEFEGPGGMLPVPLSEIAAVGVADLHGGSSVTVRLSRAAGEALADR